MLTEENKRIYERFSPNGLIQRATFNGLSLATNLILKGCLFKQEISGKENIPRGRAVYTTNHVCCFDPEMVVTAIDSLGIRAHGIIDSEEFSRHPKTYSRIQTVPLDIATTGAGAIANYKWTMREAEKWLKNEDSILVFADGPTKISKKPLPIEERINSSIPARLAIKTNSPIVPVTLYVPQAYSEKNFTWAGTNAKALLLGPRTPYLIHFSTPVYPEHFQNQTQLRSEIRQIQIEEYAHLAKRAS